MWRVALDTASRKESRMMIPTIHTVNTPTATAAFVAALAALLANAEPATLCPAAKEAIRERLLNAAKEE
jgi:hypothetical protein